MSEVLRVALEAARNISDHTKRVAVLESLMPNATCYDQVEAFHVLYEAPIEKTPVAGVPSMDDGRLKLRLDLIAEEFDELKEATASRDIVEMADALGDILYVVCGFALEAGIDLKAVVAEIQASNMTKLGADGEVIRREDGKILKGSNYMKPNISEVLFGNNNN
jgi:predicted HAD superfamily Cof-like phosphohydrolase